MTIADTLPRRCHVLSAETLQPRLHGAQWSHQPPLSDDGFTDSPAHIGLAYQLSAGLECGGAVLSYRGLTELDLGTRQAWDIAADNLVRVAEQPEGVCFYLRSASSLVPGLRFGVQVRVPGAPVTAWLAHPHTFTILNRHLELHIGAELTYFAPGPDLLLAVTHTERAAAAEWAEATVTNPLARRGEAITGHPIKYWAGFPTPALYAKPATRNSLK